MSTFTNNAPTSTETAAAASNAQHKKKGPPETVVGTEGTAKRNILRKGHGTGHVRKAGASKSGAIDDGMNGFVGWVLVSVEC